jgi:hypothetical protein
VKVDRLLAVLIPAIVFAVVAWASQPYAVGVYHDDGVYAILAKALATGEGYRYLHIPGAPLANHYPPGYPLLLALFWNLGPEFPGNVGVLLMVNMAIMALAAWCIQRFATRVLGWTPYAAAVGALVATLSYPLLLLSGLLLSEPLFAALLFPALLAGERLVRDDVRTRDAVVAGVLVGILTLVRTHAAALGLALFVLLLTRRRRLVLPFAGAAALLVAPWLIWTALHDDALPIALRGSYGSYGAWLAAAASDGLGFAARTVALNLKETAAVLADRFALSDHATPRTLTAVVAGVVLVLGGVRLWRRAPVTVLFAAVYLAVMLLWPYTPFRFLFAIWPIVVLFLGEAIRWAWELRVHRRAPAVALGAVALVLALGALRQETRAYRTRSWEAPRRGAAEQITPLVQWVHQNTAPTAIVAVDGEQLVYLFTGRRAVPMVPFTGAEYVRPRTVEANAASLRQLIETLPVNYVLTIQPALFAAVELVARDSSRVRLVPVAGLPGGGVFRAERR